MRPDETFWAVCATILATAFVAKVAAEPRAIGVDKPNWGEPEQEDFTWSCKNGKIPTHIGRARDCIWGETVPDFLIVVNKRFVPAEPPILTVYEWSGGRLNKSLEKEFPWHLVTVLSSAESRCLVNCDGPETDGEGNSPEMILQLKDVQTGKTIKSWQPHAKIGSYFRLRQSANGRFVAMVGDWHVNTPERWQESFSKGGFEVWLLDLKTEKITLAATVEGRSLFTKVVPNDRGTRIALAPLETRTSGSSSKTIAMIDVEKQELLWSRPQQGMTRLGSWSNLTASFSGDGRHLYLGDMGGTIFTLDVESGKTLSQWALPSSGKKAVRCIDVSADGQYLSVGTSGREVFVYSLKTQKAIRLEHPEEDIHLLAFSPDSQALAGFARPTVRVWPRSAWAKPVVDE